MIFNKNEEYFKNGTMWTITDIRTEFDDESNEDIEVVYILIDWDKTPIPIYKTTWNKYEAQVVWKNNTNDDNEEELIEDENNTSVSYEIVWSYTQYPFTLGWGITAHKAQWKTFDNIICDIWQISYKDWDIWVKKAVEHIVYVALSRATNYKWIQVVQWLKPESIKVNQDVKNITEKLIK